MSMGDEGGKETEDQRGMKQVSEEAYMCTPHSTLTMPAFQRPMHERRRTSAGSMRAVGAVGCALEGIRSTESSSNQVGPPGLLACPQVLDLHAHEISASSVTGSYVV